MSQNGKLMPNLDQQSTKLLNLTVLQLIDPFIEEILITAAHDVEGSLFVVKRNTQPRFQFVVMNRRNTDNLVENLLGDFEFEVQVPYLLYRNASQEVNGIWFDNARECEEVANLFSSEFEELEAVPTMAVMDGPLESTPSNAVDVPEDPAFVNFFSTALTVGNTSNAAISAQPYQSNTTISLPSHPASVASPIVPTLQIPSPPLSTPTPLIPPVDTSESGNWTPNLVKPSLFFVPPPSSYARMMQLVSSSTPTAPPLNPPLSLQRPYGAPVLQPFPLPTPPPSLTPALTSNSRPFISKEKVRETLLVLVQDNQFIDMVY
ncbi:mRNA-decapping enzyme-like protein [Citrus sinensis]|uniref:mRNA-decapping enzyme-like protein n=1 Tax=Citrus sinensis TaxID=2711 RepID=A0ACB8IRG9_CITSI|nr:mRNA-decapping enzyme-like protein [Citrus sinensis]